MAEAPIEVPPFVGLPCCVTSTNGVTTAQTFHPAAGSEFPDFFEGRETISCQRCQKRASWWTMAVHALTTRGTQEFVVPALLGAKITGFSRPLKLNDTLHVDLSEVGIPKDATVLDISYLTTSPGGDDAGVFPVEVHGNRPLRRHSHVFDLYARPFKPGTNPNPNSETKLSIGVSWIRPSEDVEAWTHLAAALREFVFGSSLEACIIPANVAVEMITSVVMTRFVRQFCSGEDTRGFLKDAATYSYQLKVLSPMLCDFYELRRLPDDIRAELNSLRNVRNDMAHRGVPKKPLVREEVGRLLAGALFGFHFARFMRSKLPSELLAD